MEKVQELAARTADMPAKLEYMAAMCAGRNKFQAAYGKNRWIEELMAYAIITACQSKHGITAADVAYKFEWTEATARARLMDLYDQEMLARRGSGFIPDWQATMKFLDVVDDVMGNKTLRNTHVKDDAGS